MEVDRATGEMRILKYVCVEDAGRVIHPQIVDGQIAGSIAQGIGGALYEHLVYDEAGNLSTGTLLDYLMPTCARDPRRRDRPRRTGRRPTRSASAASARAAPSARTPCSQARWPTRSASEVDVAARHSRPGVARSCRG